MRADTEVIMAVAFFVCGFALGNTIVLDGAPGWLDMLITAGATLVAAYAGASYAFSLQEKRDDERRTVERISSGNKVIFKFIRAYDQFSAIRSQFIAPHKDSEYRAYEIRPSVGSLGGFEPVDVNDVAYFFESENPNITKEITNLEMEIIVTLEMFAERSRIHFEVQQKLDAEKIEEGRVLKEADFRELLGPALVSHLTMATDATIVGIDTVIDGCRRLIPRLHADLKKRYPERRILKVEFPTAAQQSAPADVPASRQNG
jgi:hypothetical protein